MHLVQVIVSLRSRGYELNLEDLALSWLQSENPMVTILLCYMTHQIYSPSVTLHCA